MPPETDHARKKRRNEAREHFVRHYGNRCMICGAPPKTRALQVDHSHATGRDRGILCVRCNRALPSWVNVRWLDRAGMYVRNTEADLYALSRLEPL